MIIGGVNIKLIVGELLSQAFIKKNALKRAQIMTHEEKKILQKSARGAFLHVENAQDQKKNIKLVYKTPSILFHALHQNSFLFL